MTFVIATAPESSAQGGPMFVEKTAKERMS